ncbi:YjbF family lipoprotein [Stenotrophomonas bentonitica]|uniref:YjbF family lipoprotein n=1 Tax=Stenotrophomonas bentonitica TaxID=1450134 RepID=UPI0036F04D1C
MSRSALTAPNKAQRGIAALLLITLALTGCGVVGRTSIKTMQLAVQGTPDVQPSAAEVAAKPYPQIKVNGPNGGAVLVLGNIDAGRQAWYSSERSIVFLQDGLLVGTHGGSPELQQMWIEGDNPFHALHTLQGTVAVQRRYDLMPGYRYGIPVTGTLERLGAEPVDILGKVRTLVHVRETLRGTQWKGENHYWVDPASGFIWKSQQMIAPGTRLDITQLKPYSLDLQRR